MEAGDPSTWMSVLIPACAVLRDIPTDCHRDDLTIQDAEFDGRISHDTLRDLVRLLRCPVDWNIRWQCLSRGPDSLALMLIAAEFLDCSVVRSEIESQFQGLLRQDPQANWWPELLQLPRTASPIPQLRFLSVLREPLPAISTTQPQNISSESSCSTPNGSTASEQMSNQTPQIP